jgi:PAS domain S-box-containing protein
MNTYRSVCITLRKDAEALLRRSNERWELAKQAAGLGIWDWDIATGELNWSPEIFTLFGLDRETVSPSFAAWEAAVHPEDRVSARACIERSIRDGTLLDTECRVVHPDGNVRWIGAMGQTAYGDAGRALRMTGVCMDITERRAMLEKSMPHAAANDGLRIACIVHDTKTDSRLGIVPTQCVFG